MGANFCKNATKFSQLIFLRHSAVPTGLLELGFYFRGSRIIHKNRESLHHVATSLYKVYGVVDALYLPTIFPTSLLRRG